MRSIQFMVTVASVLFEFLLILPLRDWLLKSSEESVTNTYVFDVVFSCVWVKPDLKMSASLLLGRLRVLGRNDEIINYLFLLISVVDST